MKTDSDPNLRDDCPPRSTGAGASSPAAFLTRRALPAVNGTQRTRPHCRRESPARSTERMRVGRRTMNEERRSGVDESRHLWQPRATDPGRGGLMRPHRDLDRASPKHDCGDRVSIGRTRHDARACGSGETVGGRSYLLDRPYSKVAIIGTWSLYLRQSREDRARQLRKRPRERPRQTHSRSGSESCHVQSGSRCEDSPHRDRTCSPLIDPKHERDGASAHCDRLIPPVTFDGVHRVSHES